MIGKAILVTTKGGRNTVKILFGKETAARLRKPAQGVADAQADRAQRTVAAAATSTTTRQQPVTLTALSAAAARISPGRSPSLRLARALSRNTKYHSAASSR